mgnify:CR=1 FL=1
MNYRSLALIGLLSTPSIVQSKVIIWDIGEVIYTTNRLGVARTIGLSHFISRLFFDWKHPNITPLLFDVLEHIPCAPLPENIRLHDKDGTPLAPVQCHFQAGTMTRKEVLDGARDTIDILEDQGYFYSERERILCERAILNMFDPYTLAYNTDPIKAGLRILADCAQEVDAYGNRHNRLIALSNWDTESFDIFYQLNQGYLSLFDAMYISGKTGLIKPRKTTYARLIEQENINPEDCLVIDDLEVNLESARSLGFKTFRIQNGNYAELRRALVAFGALEQDVQVKIAA